MNIAVFFMLLGVLMSAIATSGPSIGRPKQPLRRAAAAAFGIALLAAAGRVASGCQTTSGPAPEFIPVDASDAAIGDALPAGQCAALCNHLEAVGCHPRSTCAVSCDRAVAMKVVDPKEIGCVLRAPTAGDVAQCGGGFCRP
jgi:hypothetical protein